jgi:pimeloyl-ACP methyl ester carboxylesterase
MPSLRVDGIALHHDLRGTGESIVLLHGFTSSLAGNWDRRGWIDFLAGNGHRVVALDFRSHGRSARVYEASRVTTERLAADVVALLDHLDTERADLFGFSMGGGVALQMAKDYPERVGRLVVSGVGDAAVNCLHDPRQIADILGAFEAESVTAIESPTAQAIRRSAELGGNDLRALAPFLRNGGWPGGLDAQRTVAAPVLLLVAEDDQYMAGTAELERWLSHAAVERITGRDHYTVLDDDRASESALRFLRGPGKEAASAGNRDRARRTNSPPRTARRRSPRCD